MRIGLITTLDTNIGDDFIRSGVINVIKNIYKGKQLEFVSINKHNPYSVYPAWHPIHLRNLANHLPLVNGHTKNVIETIFPKIGFSIFDGCDLIIQCGAPVFWLNCSTNEWAKPLWYEVVGRLHEQIPVLNIAAGSCYPWESQCTLSDLTADVEYIKKILGFCRLTTVRDQLAQNICKSVGNEAPLIPCSAFLAAYGREAELHESGFILINYMSGGGHFDWEQEIDNKQWEKAVKRTINALEKRHKLAFLCHNEDEYSLARQFDCNFPIFFPRTPTEYFDCISNAKFGICNRMHASVGMAGMGIPSIAVCTDTRLLMVDELGLPIYYVKDVDANILEENAEVLLSTLKSEKERLLVLQARTWEMYCSAIMKTVSLS